MNSSSVAVTDDDDCTANEVDERSQPKKSSFEEADVYENGGRKTEPSDGNKISSEGAPGSLVDAFVSDKNNVDRHNQNKETKPLGDFGIDSTEYTRRESWEKSTIGACHAGASKTQKQEDPQASNETKDIREADLKLGDLSKSFVPPPMTALMLQQGDLLPQHSTKTLPVQFSVTRTCNTAKALRSTTKNDHANGKDTVSMLPPPTEGLTRQRAGLVQMQPGAFAVRQPEGIYRREELAWENGNHEDGFYDSALDLTSSLSQQNEKVVTAEVLPQVSALDSAQLRQEYKTRIQENVILAEVRGINRHQKEKTDHNIPTNNLGNDRRRRIVLYIALLCAIIIVLCLSVGLEEAVRTHSHCAILDPGVEDDLDYLLDLFCGIAGKQALSDVENPRYQAIHWLANSDAYLSDDFRSPQNIPRLIERFSILVFYFSTGGPTSWEFQLDFLNPTSSVCSWRNEHEEHFYGISCDNQGKVTSINILYNNLTGTLPPELSQLSELRYLALTGNNLYGSLPGAYSNFTHLTDIMLMANELSGTFPEEYHHLQNLRNFGMALNSFQGSIPETYTRLTSLGAFYAAHNCLTGTIPVSIFQKLREINDFDVGGNFIEGKIPMSFTTDSIFERLSLKDNLLTGSIPESLTSFRKLKIVDMSQNHLTGTLSSEVFESLIDLEILRVNDNFLSGRLSTRIGTLQRMEELNLSKNLLTGSLPSEIGNLFCLNNLDVSFNYLRGSLPAEIGHLTRLASLKVSSNDLTSMIPSDFDALTTSLYYFFLDNTGITGGLENIFCKGGNASEYGSNSMPMITEIKADCLGKNPSISCSCCSTCCDGSGNATISGSNPPSCEANVRRAFE